MSNYIYRVCNYFFNFRAAHSTYTGYCPDVIRHVVSMYHNMNNNAKYAISLRNYAKVANIPKSTISRWINDVRYTVNHNQN